MWKWEWATLPKMCRQVIEPDTGRVRIFRPCDFEIFLKVAVLFLKSDIKIQASSYAQVDFKISCTVSRFWGPWDSHSIYYTNNIVGSRFQNWTESKTWKISTVLLRKNCDNFKGTVKTSLIPYDVKQILWCNLSHSIALHADLTRTELQCTWKISCVQKSRLP